MQCIIENWMAHMKRAMTKGYGNAHGARDWADGQERRAERANST
jgi:hypothetical protein